MPSPFLIQQRVHIQYALCVPPCVTSTHVHVPAGVCAMLNVATGISFTASYLVIEIRGYRKICGPLADPQVRPTGVGADLRV